MNNEGRFYIYMIITFMMQIGITAKYKSYISFGEEFFLTYDVGLYAVTLNLFFMIVYFII
jgi:hypothetical protein